MRLYRDPDRLAERLPTLRRLARPEADIRAAAERVAPAVAAALGPAFRVEVAPCASQIGSGALPLATLPSAALCVQDATGKGGGAPDALAAAFRRLPLPVIGRVEADAFWMDCRLLEDEAAFAANLAALPGLLAA